MAATRHSRLLLLLPLLLQTAAAASVSLDSSAAALGGQHVLEDIQSEVEIMNQQLDELYNALNTEITTTPAPTEPTTQGPTTGNPTTKNPTTKDTTTKNPTTKETTTKSPTTKETTQNSTPSPPTKKPTSKSDESAAVRAVAERLRRSIFISRQTLHLDTVGDTGDCDALRDVNATVAAAAAALDLVTEEQLADPTLDRLRDSNDQLNATTTCLADGQLEFDAAARAGLRASVSAAQDSGAAAADIIDGIVDKPTPAPADDSGFRAATITLGVLLALTLFAAVALAVVNRRQGS